MENKNQISVNLNKFISQTGVCSRREAEKFIIAERVTINGEIAQLGNRVFENDIVKVDGQPLKAKPKTLYIAFNKPVGIVCTTDLKEKNNIIDYINHQERLFPIGRLDKPSQGLIFLTNDGNIVNKILRAGNNHDKEYVVAVDRSITPDFIKKMENGLPILNTITKKCKVTQIDEFSFKIILTQGLNRQIRRMCTYLDYEVIFLKRTRIMNVELGNLKKGESRELTSDEMIKINQMISTSSKTEEVSKDQQQHKKRNYRKNR